MSKRKEELTVTQAARRLGIDPGYLYMQLRAGRIAGRKAGRQWRVDAAAVEERLRQREARNG